METPAPQSAPVAKNPSLLKKSAARLCAVQCMYTQSVGSEPHTPAQQVAALKAELAGNPSEQKLRLGSAIEPNYTLLESLLEGVGKWQEEITPRVDSMISKSWGRERTGPLLIAILQCAVFEMLFGKDVRASIIIDEYTRLTRCFFTEAEVDFVYGALSTLAKAHERI